MKISIFSALVFLLMSCGRVSVPTSLPTATPAEEPPALESPPSESPVTPSESGLPSALEERIVETAASGEQAMYVRPNIQSTDDLSQYRAMKISEAQTIVDMRETQSAERPYYPVVITMRSPTSFQEVNRLIRRYNPSLGDEATRLINRNVKALPKGEFTRDVDGLMLQEAEFASSVGGGKLSYETLSDPAELAQIEAIMAAKEIEYNGNADYQLIRGITSIRGGIHRNAVLRLEDDPMVFLADIGPKELYDGTVSTARWNDITQEVERYLAP